MRIGSSAEKPRLEGLAVLDPRVYPDDRGYFFEAFNGEEFSSQVDPSAHFVQDNQSRSRKNVLRGLHYQVEPMAQGKLVRVVKGAVYDVVVDIRRSSDAFGQWFGIELTEENLKQIWIPPGFAHGFLALTDPADLLYKVTQRYSSSHDRSIRWDDPTIGINWPLRGSPLLSEKDATAPYLSDAETLS